jgi:hypothetical protein
MTNLVLKSMILGIPHSKNPQNRDLAITVKGSGMPSSYGV